MTTPTNSCHSTVGSLFPQNPPQPGSCLRWHMGDLWGTCGQQPSDKHSRVFLGRDGR